MSDVTTREDWYEEHDYSHWNGKWKWYTGDVVSLVKNESYFVFDSFSDMLKDDYREELDDPEVVELIDEYINNAQSTLGELGLNTTDYKYVLVMHPDVPWHLVVGNGKVFDVESEEEYMRAVPLGNNGEFDCPVLEQYILNNVK